MTDSAPMTAVAILAGSLGPCLTDAIRSDELSTVRTISVLLRAHLARDLDSTTAVSPSADPLLALPLRGYVISAYRSLNEVFVAATLNEFTMQQESMSSYKYFLGKEQEKIAVEAQGMLLIDDERACCCSRGGVALACGAPLAGLWLGTRAAARATA